MKRIVIVAIGGAIGAVARYGIGMMINSVWPIRFPLGTFVINITGSFIIGAFLTIFENRSVVPATLYNWEIWANLRLLIAVGFVGAYTTFSTFEYETLKLIEEDRTGTAILYLILSITVGLISVWLGVKFARLIIPGA